MISTDINVAKLSAWYTYKKCAQILSKIVRFKFYINLNVYIYT